MRSAREGVSHVGFIIHAGRRGEYGWVLATW